MEKNVYVVEVFGADVPEREIVAILENYGTIDDVMDELENEYQVRFACQRRRVTNCVITWKAENAQIFVRLTKRTLR